MKKHLLLALLILSFAACTSYEQRLAVECIKPHLKCPSTMKVVDFSYRYVEADTVRDTTYHIMSINGSRKDRMYYPCDLKNVVADSMRITTKIYPAHKLCVVKFDSQNLMGAMVRNTESVVICGNEAQTWNAWWDRCHYRRTMQDIAIRNQFKSPNVPATEFIISIGDWVELSE